MDVAQLEVTPGVASGQLFVIQPEERPDSACQLWVGLLAASWPRSPVASDQKPPEIPLLSPVTFH